MLYIITTVNSNLIIFKRTYMKLLDVIVDNMVFLSIWLAIIKTIHNFVCGLYFDIDILNNQCSEPAGINAEDSSQE